MLKGSTIIFRTDGSLDIGFGHIMRCLALAEGFRERGVRCIFATKDYHTGLLDKIRECGHKVEIIPKQCGFKKDLSILADAYKKYRATIIVTDCYALTADYIKNIKEWGVFLISIDDLARIHYYSDIVINGNIYADELSYSKEPYTRLLLGTDYALLRREFRENHNYHRVTRVKIRHILVTLGGADPDNQAVKVIRALRALHSGIVTTIIMGSRGKEQKELEDIVKKNNDKFLLKFNVQNMSEFILKSDLAISGGGSTCYELACLGLPNIILVLADNQEKITENLTAKGISVNLGWFRRVREKDIKTAVEELAFDWKKRKRMSDKGKSMVDGNGVTRVVDIIKIEKEKSNGRWRSK